MPSNWRIMGQWRDGAEFLLVMGRTATECLTRIDEAAADYGRNGLSQVEYLWLERWDPGTTLREPAWRPAKEISLRRLRIRATRQTPPGRSRLAMAG